MEIFRGEQGTDEWLQFRMGHVSASSMSKVMAKGAGKTRLAYMYQLIGEVITGQPNQVFTGNIHTERGHELEPIYRGLYEKTTGVVVEEIGSIRSHDDIGGVIYSPDGLVGENGLLEIKTRLPHIQAELLETGRIPSDAMNQMQSGLWVSGRQWCDYLSGCPGMPSFRKRIEPDQKLIEKMRVEVIAFYAEMNKKLTKIGEYK